MKILALSNLYPPDFIGGYELACRQVVDALAARGHDVLVLTSSPRTPVAHDPRVLRRLEIADIYDPYTIHRSAPIARALDEARSHLVNAHNVYELIRAIEEFGPDVAYVCNVMGLGGLGLIGCLRYLGVPWAWQLGDCIPALLCHLRDRVVPELAREFGRLADGHYIAVSRRLHREIEAMGPRLAGEVHLLPNWIHGDLPPPRSATYRPGDRLRIASAGQLAPHKGVDILIEAIALLRDQGLDNVSVDIYGKVNDVHYPCMIQRAGVEDRVRLRGLLPHDELTARMGQYDLFAFPTWEREPFGMAPLEAMARGCVPAMSRSCGVGEWLVHGVHCLKVERSAAAFAAAFRGVIEGATDLGPLARRGAALARRDFHLEVLIVAIEGILAAASAGPREAAGTAEDAYRVALMAEKLSRVLIHESQVA